MILTLGELAYLCDPANNHGKYSIYSSHESSYIANLEPSINPLAYQSWLESNPDYYMYYAANYEGSNYFEDLDFKNNADVLGFFSQWKNIIDDYGVVKDLSYLKQNLHTRGEELSDSDQQRLKDRSLSFKTHFRIFCRAYNDKNDLISLLYEPIVVDGIPIEDVTA